MNERYDLGKTFFIDLSIMFILIGIAVVLGAIFNPIISHSARKDEWELRGERLAQ